MRAKYLVIQKEIFHLLRKLNMTKIPKGILRLFCKLNMIKIPKELLHLLHKLTMTKAKIVMLGKCKAF
ncbi:hypothetical protein DMC01_07905 [Campylobacter troglodytis]|nr:hypothetical protein DMC01_07905 [Campylobacter troglodytis]